MRYSSLKCSKQTFTVRPAIVTPFLRLFCPQRRTGNWKKLFLSCGRFHSLLMAFRNSKTRRQSEIKQTRPSTKQDFSGEALSKQNTEASLASLSWNSFRAPTEWSAIFTFGVFRWTNSFATSRSRILSVLALWVCNKATLLNVAVSC